MTSSLGHCWFMATARVLGKKASISFCKEGARKTQPHNSELSLFCFCLTLFVFAIVVDSFCVVYSW